MGLKRGGVPGAGERICTGEHRFDGLDAGDRFFREWESEGNSAEQFAVDIYGATAHTLHDAGLSKRTAAESGENDALLWTEIIEHAEDFDLELFNLLAVKDGPADAVHAGADIFEWEEALSGAGLSQKK